MSGVLEDYFESSSRSLQGNLPTQLEKQFDENEIKLTKTLMSPITAKELSYDYVTTTVRSIPFKIASMQG